MSIFVDLILYGVNKYFTFRNFKSVSEKIYRVRVIILDFVVVDPIIKFTEVVVDVVEVVVDLVEVVEVDDDIEGVFRFPLIQSSI